MGFSSRVAARLRRAAGANEPPSRIAGAWALGIAIGLSPLLGAHAVLALLLAVILRVNKMDAVLGTLIINPWTLPLYFPAAVLLGQRLTGVSVGRVEIPAASALLDLAVWQAQAVWMKPLLVTWATGALSVALPAGTATFFLVRWLIARRRQAQLLRSLARP